MSYYKATVRNTELIFTEKNQSFAEHAAGVEQDLQPDPDHLRLPDGLAVICRTDL